MLIARYKASQTKLLVFQGDLQMSELKQFQVQTARPLPVIVLADTSGSMSVDGKIDALNRGLKDMVLSFASESCSATIRMTG